MQNMFSYIRETKSRQMVESAGKMIVVTVSIPCSFGYAPKVEELCYHNGITVYGTEGYYNKHRMRAVGKLLPVTVGQEIKSDTYEKITVIAIEEKPLLVSEECIIKTNTYSIHKSMVDRYETIFVGICTHGSWGRAEEIISDIKDMKNSFIIKNRKNKRRTWCDIVFSVPSKYLEGLPSCEYIAYFATEKEALIFSRKLYKAYD